MAVEVAGQTVGEVRPGLPQVLGCGVGGREGAAVRGDLLLVPRGVEAQLAHHLTQGDVPVLLSLRDCGLPASILILDDGGKLGVEIRDAGLVVALSNSPLTQRFLPTAESNWLDLGINNLNIAALGI